MRFLERSLRFTPACRKHSLHHCSVLRRREVGREVKTCGHEVWLAFPAATSCFPLSTLFSLNELCSQVTKPNIETLLAFDEKRDQYLWFQVGWTPEERIKGISVHIRIKNEKIYICKIQQRLTKANFSFTSHICRQALFV